MIDNCQGTPLSQHQNCTRALKRGMVTLQVLLAYRPNDGATVSALGLFISWHSGSMTLLLVAQLFI